MTILNLKRDLLFTIVTILGCIAIIPSPLVLLASIMSAAGGGCINWKNPIEILMRLFWILTIFYPVYIALPFFYGKKLILDKNKKAGYLFVVLSGLLSICIIILFISIFI